MGWFDNDSQEAQHYDDYENAPHQAKLSHEALGAAAAFYAAKKYEDHVAENGKPPSHALAKELLAGFAGGYIDKQVETKGLDYLDRQKALDNATIRSDNALADAYDRSNNYGGGGNYSNNDSYGSGGNYGGGNYRDDGNY